MTTEDALAFIQKHGVVLVAGKGPVPRLVDAIAGEPIKGSWWGHPKGHEIFRALSELGDSSDILVCRLVDGKISFVHRRLWSALVRLANHFPAERLARVRQEHTARGHHINHSIPFPQWVPAAVSAEAARLTDQQALAELKHLLKSAAVP